ncbi:MAG: NAD(P)/FAD-dependent oxidoreductase [Deltaproteobacteria bacterium]|nr:MAG: NAD(P)/FAD-dependent oxidoreductase [Deltaproteobacteria bacterium]
MNRRKYRSYDYEAIIIGSGIGGLTAGAYLAREGVKVLICEMHSQPGGYLTSFKRQGYTFDGGIQGLQDGGMLLAMVKDLGLKDRIEFHKCKYAVAGSDFFLPIDKVSDVVTFYDNLKRVFPEQVPGLDHISREAEAYCKLMFSFNQIPNPMYASWGEFFREFPGWYRKHKSSLKPAGDFIRNMRTPMEEYFQRHVDHPDLLRLLNQLSYSGSPVSFALIFITFLMDYYYPGGGVQSFSDLLAECITENGGQIRYRTLIEEIIMEKGRARGVKTAGGEVIRAPFIISNSDARRTYLKMLPAEAVPESYRQGIQRAGLSEAFFTIFLGVDIPPEEIDTRGCSHIVYWPDYKGIEIERYHTGDESIYDNAPVVVNCNSISDPSLAPKGKSSMTIQTVAFADFADNWGTENGKRTPRYKELKERVTDKLIATAEDIVPGLSKRIEVRFSGTPLTFQRYTLNSGGSSLGWNCHPEKGFNGGWKVFTGFSPPVKSLYHVGHWTMSPGGTPSGYMTGKIVSNIVSKRLRWGI